MQATCRVRLVAGKPWYAGELVMDGRDVILICGNRLRHPKDVDCVAVYQSCPVELLDAAVDVGFFVVGQPRVPK